MATKNLRFSFNDLLFRQIDGIAMGSPSGPFFANIFFGYYENNLLCSSQTKPLAFYKYVDNVFAIVPSKTNVDSFYKRMHKCIVFTVENEIPRIKKFVRYQYYKK